jgi:uncharacterized membrane protein
MEEKRETVMDRSGAGPLLGVVLALCIVLAAMAGLLLGSWVALAIAVAVVVVTLAAVTLVITAIASDDDDDHSSRLRGHIPGLR